MSKYENQVAQLQIAIDCALEVFKSEEAKIYDKAFLNHLIDSYQNMKADILNAEEQYRNLTSLKYSTADVFTFFQESGGRPIELFWELIKKNELPFKRENKMKKIIKRKKINNIHEYDFVVDCIIPYHQQGLIDDSEKALLSQIIGDFEGNNSKS